MRRHRDVYSPGTARVQHPYVRGFHRMILLFLILLSSLYISQERFCQFAHDRFMRTTKQPKQYTPFRLLVTGVALQPLHPRHFFHPNSLALNNFEVTQGSAKIKRLVAQRNELVVQVSYKY